MAVDIGNILIGLGVLITTISAILFKIKYIRNKTTNDLGSIAHESTEHSHISIFVQLINLEN